VELEPAVDAEFSVESSLRQAEACFARGIPAIVSMHSVNLHSTVKDFRSATLSALDHFFTALESRHPNLLYLHDEDLLALVSQGSYSTAHGTMQVNVVKKNFTKTEVASLETPSKTLR
jgi:hypothetical protein